MQIAAEGDAGRDAACLDLIEQPACERLWRPEELLGSGDVEGKDQGRAGTAVFHARREDTGAGEEHAAHGGFRRLRAGEDTDARKEFHFYTSHALPQAEPTCMGVERTHLFEWRTSLHHDAGLCAQRGVKVQPCLHGKLIRVEAGVLFWMCHGWPAHAARLVQFVVRRVGCALCGGLRNGVMLFSSEKRRRAISTETSKPVKTVGSDGMAFAGSKRSSSSALLLAQEVCVSRRMATCARSAAAR